MIQRLKLYFVDIIILRVQHMKTHIYELLKIPNHIGQSKLRMFIGLKITIKFLIKQIFVSQNGSQVVRLILLIIA